MSATTAEIFEMAKALPKKERWELMEKLSSTFSPPEPDGMTREEFLAELRRRSEECDAGRMTSSPWREVMDRLEQKNRADG
ncbi:MAG TPA: addiction module protein [Gemmataceae bacterium]|jgi:putative addiction module component (TIGR02574 family)|nr:addiction module protein [Gemmataceae bacterium]